MISKGNKMSNDKCSKPVFAGVCEYVYATQDRTEQLEISGRDFGTLLFTDGTVHTTMHGWSAKDGVFTTHFKGLYRCELNINVRWHEIGVAYSTIAAINGVLQGNSQNTWIQYASAGTTASQNVFLLQLEENDKVQFYAKADGDVFLVDKRSEVYSNRTQQCASLIISRVT